MSYAPADITGDASVLIASLSNNFDALSDQLVGAVDRAFATVRVPKCLLAVVRGLLNHVGYHSNRVWCSQVRIEDLLRELGTPDASLTSIKRSMRHLRAKKLVREIDDPGELIAGPGPHHYPEQLRESTHRVTTYDLGGLLALLRVVVIGARAPQPVPALRDEIGDRNPFADTTSARSAYGPISKPTSPDPPPRPAGQPPDPLALGQVATHKIPPRSRQPHHPEGPIFPRSNLTDRNNMYRRSNAPADGEADGKGAKGNPVGKRPAPDASSATPAVSMRHVAQPLTPADEAMVETLRRRIPGLYEFVAKGWVRRWGYAWCEMLLAYGQECDIRDGETHGREWYVAIAKNWRRGDGEWPTWLKKREASIKRAEEAIGRTAEVEISRTPVIKKPAPPAVAALTVALDALDEPARQALLDRALAVVMGSLTGRMIARGRQDHPLVRAKAAELLAEDIAALPVEEEPPIRGP